MLKKYALLISVAYSLALVAMSLIKLDFSNMDVVVPSYSDKVFHFIAYALLVWLWFFAVYTRTNYSKLKTLIQVAIACAVFGTIIEVLQKEITNTRSFDLYDIAANALGVLTACLVLLIYNKTDVKY
ncbi:VanZ family protein [Bizionia sediminis]|uniref:VanZ family protein n=1 Tax=Bizionia sediminis TaxID=1737064 RepID=A0ABW5KX18_9FLAO